MNNSQRYQISCLSDEDIERQIDLDSYRLETIGKNMKTTYISLNKRLQACIDERFSRIVRKDKT